MAGRGRVGRPVDRDGEQTRRRILDVALVQLAERGYARTTFESIADDVGITSRAVYHYFRSKPDLVSTLLVEWREFSLSRIEHLRVSPMPFRDRLVGLFDASAAVYAERPEAAAFATGVLGDAVRAPELDEELHTSRNDLARFYGQLVDDAVAGDELAAGVDRHGMVELIAGLSFGMATIAAASLDRHDRALSALRALIDGELTAVDRQTEAAPSAGTAQ